MLQKKDFGNDSPLLGSFPAVITSDSDGASCDLINHGSCLIAYSVGNSGDTLSSTVYIELEVQTSSDGSTWVAAPDADVTATVTGTNTGTVAKIDAPAEDSKLFTAAYTGGERYVRGSLNLTGTHTNGCAVSLAYTRSRAKYA